MAPVLFPGIFPLYPQVSVLLSGMGSIGPAGAGGGAGGGNVPMYPDWHSLPLQLPLFAGSSEVFNQHAAAVASDPLLAAAAVAVVVVAARQVQPLHPATAVQIPQQSPALPLTVLMSLAW